jgi:Flp pilus assembly protein TadG
MAARLVRRSSGTRGQTLVEFALSVLMLVMLLIGVVEISRMVLMYTTVANAAKAGARYAIVNGSDASSPSGPSADDPTVITVVKNFASAGGLNTANLTVHVNYYSVGGVTPACNTVGCWVQVTASYPYNPLTSYFPISTHLGSTSEGAITF